MPIIKYYTAQGCLAQGIAVLEKEKTPASKIEFSCFCCTTSKSRPKVSEVFIHPCWWSAIAWPGHSATHTESFASFIMTFHKDKSPVVSFHGITLPYSYFEEI